MFLLALVLIVTKAKAAYEFPGGNEKINHPLLMDKLKSNSRNEKGLLDSLVQKRRIFS